MKVGLYFDLRTPRAGDRSPARVYAHTLELCQEAEKVGIDSVWFSEHHGFDDGYLPQPLVYAAAAAARTTRLRIGTAVLVAPLHATVELAEQAAVVDLVSDGRLDLGIGAGYRPSEFELFGQDRDSRFERLRAQVRDLRSMWSGDEVTPSPVQDPIPIWVGTGGSVGARGAGRLGAGLLFLSPERLDMVRQGRREAGLDPAGARMSGPLFALASEDPDRDRAAARRWIGYQQNSYRAHSGVRASQRDFDLESAHAKEQNTPGAFWFDTPEAIAQRLATWLGDETADTVFLWAALGDMTEAEIDRNVEMITRRLAPLIHELDPGADTREVKDSA